MKKISNNSNSNYKRFMRKICWGINDTMKWLRDHFFCYHDVDMDEVKEKIKETEHKAEQFEIIEEVAPEIQHKLEELKRVKLSFEYLQNDFTSLVHHLNVLYFADKVGDSHTKNIVYNELKDAGYIQDDEFISNGNTGSNLIAKKEVEI